MAFSGSNDFTYTRDQIIKAALRKCRAYDLDGGAPEPYQIRDAAEALNLIVKALHVHGTLLWSRSEKELRLAKNKSTYTVGPNGDLATTRPIRIHNPRWRDITTKEDIPIDLKGRDDFNNLTNKFSTGRPSWAFYDRKIAEAEIRVWPVPEDSKGKLIFTADIPLQDFDASGDDAHMPSYAYRFCVWALAGDLAPEYGIPLPERAEFKFEAKEAREELLDFEEDSEGLQMVPDTSYRV